MRGGKVFIGLVSDSRNQKEKLYTRMLQETYMMRQEQSVRTRTTKQCVQGQIGARKKKSTKTDIDTNKHNVLGKISQDWISKPTCMYCVCRTQSSPLPMHNARKANIVPSEEIDYKKNRDK